MGGAPDGGAPSGKSGVVEADAASSVDLAAQVVGKWEPTLTRAYGWQQEGVEQLRARVSALPGETLRQMAGAQTWQRFTELMIDAERVRAAPAMAHEGFVLDESDPDVAKIMQATRKVLGDQARDLTFIPTKPCRIFDTRFETIGSPTTGRFASATTKEFWAYTVVASGDFSSYGGNTGCVENSTAGPLAGDDQIDDRQPGWRRLVGLCSALGGHEPGAEPGLGLLRPGRRGALLRDGRGSGLPWYDGVYGYSRPVDPVEHGTGSGR